MTQVFVKPSRLDCPYRTSDGFERAADTIATTGFAREGKTAIWIALHRCQSRRPG